MMVGCKRSYYIPQFPHIPHYWGCLYTVSLHPKYQDFITTLSDDRSQKLSTKGDIWSVWLSLAETVGLTENALGAFMYGRYNSGVHGLSTIWEVMTILVISPLVSIASNCYAIMVLCFSVRSSSIFLQNLSFPRYI